MQKDTLNIDHPSNRYQELDALRGLAALLVVFFHFTLGRPEAQLGFKLGVTGVNLFFIISGFVIFMSLTKVNTSVDFIINRFSRLYPTYWACVTFTFLLISIVSISQTGGITSIDIVKYLGNMTMFQFYLKIPDLDGPYWTMIIEMIFYICMLLLFRFRALKFINVIGISMSLLVVGMVTFFYTAHHHLVRDAMRAIPLLQYIPLFFAGIVFYKIYIYKKKLLLNYAMVLTCFICQMLLFNYSGKAQSYISHGEDTLMLVIYFGLFILFVNGKLKFIVSKTSLFLGKISFALYLIHQYVSLGVIIPFLTNTLHLNFWIASVFIALPIIIILASLITYYIEVPMRIKIKTALGYNNVLSRKNKTGPVQEINVPVK